MIRLGTTYDPNYRYLTDWLCRVTPSDRVQPFDCIVRDISEKGARLDSVTSADRPLQLVVGEAVTLIIDSETSLAGVVVWQQGGSTGIRFSERVPSDLVIQIARHPRKR